MEIIEAARKLGEAVQQDERFIRFAKARLANDNDKELQDKIGEFNTARMNLEREVASENKREEKINALNEQLRKIYGDIMATPAMLEYNTAKGEIDAMLNDINSIIMQCVEGADPASCEPERHNCTGSCSTCGGCH